jgi:Lon protease-like protein
MSDDLPDVQGPFGGIARLFPLPNVVLFPAVTQGLHIFEPRYRQMTADAVADDQLLAVVLLRPGWEADYAGRPPIHPVACLGRIVTHECLEDGRYNLQLRGLARIRLGEEIDTGKLYRTARAELLRDEQAPPAATDLELRRRLAQILLRGSPAQGQQTDFFRKLLQSELPVGMAADILSFVLPLAMEVKQELLAMLDVERRVRALVQHLETKIPTPIAPAKTSFPPDFSNN